MIWSSSTLEAISKTNVREKKRTNNGIKRRIGSRRTMFPQINGCERRCRRRGLQPPSEYGNQRTLSSLGKLELYVDSHCQLRLDG